jgi:hypothetical protein
VQSVLGLQWRWAIELFEGSWEIAWHGDVDASFVTVPVEGEATAEGAGPIDGEFVVGFECVN